VNSTIALTVVAIPTIARLVRANTMAFSQREFVLASRTLGASHLRVITKELLPNVFLALLPFIPLAIAVAIAAEGALAYLGQSVEPPGASLGGMISQGQPQLEQGKWWVPGVPIVVLLAVLISLNLIGDRLREFFTIKDSAL
jgi:peptide/nickel transport system permease protein